MDLVVGVGVYVIKEDEILMVKEKKEGCRGLWAIPAGGLEINEDIFAGAIREAKEETGYDVKLTGLIGIRNVTNTKNKFGCRCQHIIQFSFTAEVIGTQGDFHIDEIKESKFIKIKDILAMTDKEMRATYTKDHIKAATKKKIFPLEIISSFDASKYNVAT